MSYTKGTWRYDPLFDAVVVFNDNKIKMVADFGKCDLPEREANAKLIAAAPELLEAILSAREHVRFGQDLEHIDVVLTDAINKALGNQ